MSMWRSRFGAYLRAGTATAALIGLAASASMAQDAAGQQAANSAPIVVAQASDALPEVIVEQREARRRRAARAQQARPQPVRARPVRARARPAPVVASPAETIPVEQSGAPQPAVPSDLPGENIISGPISRAIESPQSNATIVSAAQIEQSGQSNAYEALIGAPNITPAPAGGQFLPPIRGEITDGPQGLGGGFLFNTQPSAPIIVDDVARVSSIANSNFQGVYDVDNVAVLRGPQLFLPGALGFSGAYIVNTNDPSYVTEAEAFTEVTSNDISGSTYRAAGLVNAPIVADQLAVRLVAEYEDGSAPFIVRQAAPEALVPFGLPPVPPGTNLGELNDFDALRLRGKVLAEPKGIPGLSVLLQGEYEEGTDQSFDAFVNNSFFTGRPEKDRIQLFGNQRIFDTESRVGIVNAAYEFGQHAEIRSITSYVYDLFNTNPLSNDFGTTFDTIEEERRAQDVILSFGPKTGFNGVAGFTYTELNRGGDVLALAISQDSVTETRAAYADFSVPLSSSWWLLTGARVHDYESDINQNILGAVVDFQENVTKFLPRIGLRYDFSPTASLVATATDGWNPGGALIDFTTLTSVEYEAEERWTYELAYKKNWSDRTSFRAAAFYNNFTNKQFYLTTTNLQTIILNEPKSQSYGAEFELRTGLTQNLDAFGGIGLVHTEIEEITFDTPPDILGNEFGLDPSITTSFGLAWRPIQGLELSGKVVYVAEYFGDFTNDPLEISGDYVLLDASASYTWRNLTARAFVNNLTDEFAVYQRLSDSGPYVLPPRTFGASLKVAF